MMMPPWIILRFLRYSKPLIIHTTHTHTLVVLSYMCSHSCTGADWWKHGNQPAATPPPLPRPPPNSHLYSLETMWVKCLPQGHNNRLRCSRIWTANLLVKEQSAQPSEPQSATNLPTNVHVIKSNVKSFFCYCSCTNPCPSTGPMLSFYTLFPPPSSSLLLLCCCCCCPCLSVCCVWAS